MASFPAMVALAIFSLLGGVVAGMRFSFLAMIPATVFGIAEVALLGYVMGQAWGIIFQSMFFAVTALQFGYIAGALMRPSRSTGISLLTSIRSASRDNSERIVDNLTSE